MICFWSGHCDEITLPMCACILSLSFVDFTAWCTGHVLLLSLNILDLLGVESHQSHSESLHVGGPCFSVRALRQSGFMVCFHKDFPTMYSPGPAFAYPCELLFGFLIQRERYFFNWNWHLERFGIFYVSYNNCSSSHLAPWTTWGTYLLPYSCSRQWSGCHVCLSRF